MKNVLVTGATGFIGSNLVRRLVKSGYKVTIFVPKNSNHPFLKNLKLKRAEGDIRNYDALSKAIKGCDYVFHLAAIINPEKKELFDVNVNGTENVMKACLNSKVKKVVHVSSTSVLGFSTSKKKKISEKDEIKEEGYLYAKSKKMAEDIAQKYADKGLNATIANPSSVIGAGEVNPIILKLVRSINENKIRFTFSGGTCLVAVEDAVDGLLLALKKGKKGERYIFAGEYISFIDECNLIAKILNKPNVKLELPRIFYYPLYLLALIMQTFFRKSLITSSGIKHAYSFRNFDTSKARKELGWKPKIKIEDAMQQTIRYYKSQGLI